MDEVKHEISSIVGLPDIKEQLGSILEKIIDAEKDAAEGLRVVPPKPFHMVFVGNSGTGAFFFALSSCCFMCYLVLIHFWEIRMADEENWAYDYDFGVD